MEVIRKLSSQNKVNTFVLLEMNCKKIAYKVLKFLILYINDVMELYYI